MLDQKRLIRSSRSMIRKKRSPLARSIAKGNVKTILKASTDRVHGSLTREQKEKICRILCEAKHKAANVVKSKKARELLMWAITSIIGAINMASGLIISFLWVLLHQLDDVICKCKLTGECFEGTCSEMA